MRFVCNPPFMGGHYLSGRFGDAYRDHLQSFLTRNAKGKIDLSAYFILTARLVVVEMKELQSDCNQFDLSG